MPDRSERLKPPASSRRPADPLGSTDPLHPPLVTRRARILFATVLTERDRAILRALLRHRILTIELIEWAFFPPRKGRHAGRSSPAYARIARLHAEGYIAEAQPPSPPGHGSAPRLLFIDRRGVVALAETDRPGPRPVPRDPLGGFAFRRHTLAVSRAWAALVSALREST